MITPEGTARFAQARPTHIAGVRRLFLDPLKKKDQRALADAFGVVLGGDPGLVNYARGGCAHPRNSSVGARPCRSRSRASIYPLDHARASSAAIATVALVACSCSRRSRWPANCRTPTTPTRLCALRGLPARPPQPRRHPALESVCLLGPALRRRPAVRRVVPTGAAVLRVVRTGDRHGADRQLPLPAGHALLLVRVRAPGGRGAPWGAITRGWPSASPAPAGALAGPRAADWGRVAGGLRRRSPVRGAARGPRGLGARARLRARALDPGRLATADGGGRHGLAGRARDAAALARPRRLRRGRSRRARAHRGRAAAAARAGGALDGRQRGGRPGRHGRAAGGPTRA